MAVGPAADPACHSTEEFAVAANRWTRRPQPRYNVHIGTHTVSVESIMSAAHDRRVDAIIAEALQLPPQSRQNLLEQLEDSLQGDFEAPPGVLEAWAAEIESRLEAYDKGVLQARDARAALEEIRATFRKNSAQRTAS